MLPFTPTNLPSTRFTWDGSHTSEKKHVVVLYGQNLLFHLQQDGGRHVEEDMLERHYRQQGDHDMDRLLEALVQDGHTIGNNLDVVGLMADAAARASAKMASNSKNCATLSPSDQELVSLYRKYSAIPSWVDEAALARGQEVFLAYAPAIGLSLFYRSLVPGFSLPKIAAVLLSTGYLAPPASATQVQRRLLDTGAFLAAVVAQTVDSLLPPPSPPSPSAAPVSDTVAGAGWKAALQVRVLHAKVRRALLRRSSNSRRCWDREAYGVPINQEDMSATLLAFSYNALLGCEMIKGFPLSVRERLDYLQFWRYIGWLLGVECHHDCATRSSPSHQPRNKQSSDSLPPLDPCGPGWKTNDPDPLQHSNAMFASILVHLSKPDSTSVKIAHHLLRVGSPAQDSGLVAATRDRKMGLSKGRRDDDKSKRAWFYFRSYQCRRFIGDELADALLLPLYPIGIRRVSLYFASTFYLWMLRFYTWACLPQSPFRGPLVRFHRKNFARFLLQWRANFLPSNKRSGESVSSSSCPFALLAPPQY